MRVVTASDDRTARLWNTATSRPIGEPLKGHVRSVLSAAFSPDGKVIVTAGKRPDRAAVDATTGQPIGNWLSGYDDTIESVAFSPDGKRIVTASYDGTARLWEPATRQQIGKPLRGHQDIVFRAAFSPDGQRIVTASRDGTARVLGRRTQACLSEATIISCLVRRSVPTASDRHRVFRRAARIWTQRLANPLANRCAGMSAG